MVILFSAKNKSIEKEITEILSKFCVDNILGDLKDFKNYNLNENFIGVCEEYDKKALRIFKKNNIPVISCGMNNKNTVTITSNNSRVCLVSLQRTIINSFGEETEPAEYKINLTRAYSSIAVMISAAILLLKNIVPLEF